MGDEIRGGGHAEPRKACLGVFARRDFGGDDGPARLTASVHSQDQSPYGVGDCTGRGLASGQSPPAASNSGLA